jgi:HK97 gp10 family phage protein
MANKFVWRGDQFQKIVKAGSAQRLEAAAILLQNELKTVLVAKDNIDGTKPSEPGEAPAKETGRLSSSISREVDKEAMTARVGSNVVYSKFLEIGTDKLAARPWLRPTYDRLAGKIKQILTGKK